MDTIVEMNESDSELLSLIVNDDNGKDDHGFTAKEIAKILGWGEKKTLRRINQLIAVGMVECIMAYRKYNTGVWNKVPVYRLKAG